MKNKLPPQYKNWLQLYDAVKDSGILSNDLIIVENEINNDVLISSGVCPFPDFKERNEIEIPFLMQNVLNELLKERENKKQSFVNFHIEALQYLNVPNGIYMCEKVEEIARKSAEQYFDIMPKNQ
jgi:hypothetical protein